MQEQNKMALASLRFCVLQELVEQKKTILDKLTLFCVSRYDSKSVIFWEVKAEILIQ